MRITWHPKQGRDYAAGVDAHGKFLGKPVPTGVRPRFTDKFADLGITLSPRVFAPPPAHARQGQR